jgi:hypothetical protein
MFRKNFGLILFIIGICALLFGGFALYFYFMIPDIPLLSIRKNSGNWGEFGNYLGGVLNPAFSFLALLVLLWTLRLQNESLKDTSTSNDEQKKLLEQQLKESAIYNREQKNLLELQLFENTFYNLLNYYKGIVDGNEEYEGTNYLKGKDCFKYYYNNYIKEGWALPGEELGIPEKKNALERYKIFDEKYSHKIGHYFRVLYRIFKFISESELDEEKKYFYSGIVRGQLSSYELLILFYNCLTDNGFRFKNYAKDYALFENMPTDYIKEVADFLKEYGPLDEAQKYFGDNTNMKDYHDDSFTDFSNDLNDLKV